MPNTALVLGAGIAGLTSALALLEAGFRVTVKAHRFSPDITSSVAAGLWFPYAVSGARVADFAIETLRWYASLYERPDAGVRPFRCRSIVALRNEWPFWSDEDVEFVPRASTASTVHGFEATLPVADSSVFLNWLQNEIRALGGSLELLANPIQDLASPLRDLSNPVRDLSDREAPVIVNCTGIGARTLCDDGAVYPIKGTVVLVENPGVDYCLTDDADPAIPTYLIPTSAGLILGGTADIGQWDLTIDGNQVADIISRCAAHEPRVRDARIIRVKTGLRPARNPIRVEAEALPDGRTVIHNYGHGGSGYTVAWGTARAVVDLATDLT